MARFPDGWVFTVQPKRMEVIINKQELVMCKHCKHATVSLADVIWCDRFNHICAEDWFCADGELEEVKA